MYKQAVGQVAVRGYTNVMTFKGGIPAWIGAGYTLDKTGSLDKSDIPTIGVDQLKAILGNVTILDIRSPKLYAMGWISGSVKIPLGKLSSEYGAIDKGKPVVVIDHAGKQVLAAGRFLKSKGYGDVQRLQGGLMTWSRKGYPLER
jgi:rhodanese-related sulfurtransferase